MNTRRRRRLLLLISIAILIGGACSNVYYFGQAVGGHYDWVCDGCGVELYTCPAKKITYLAIPATYQPHQHTWKLVHRSPKWSRWKPWHWLVYAWIETQVLAEPDPAPIFQLAYPQEKYSDAAGLRKLASDPHYGRAKEIGGWSGDATSRPG